MLRACACGQVARTLLGGRHLVQSLELSRGATGLEPLSCTLTRKLATALPLLRRPLQQQLQSPGCGDFDKNITVVGRFF